MLYTADDISEIGLNQLSSQEVSEGVEAFNEFGCQFGRAWVDEYVQGAMSRSIVLCIVSYWADWCSVSSLPNADDMQKRWRHGMNEDGVLSEVRVVAGLLRHGAAVEISSSHTAGPDLRFRADPGSEWTYAEISHRGLSKLRKRAEHVLTTVSRAACDAVEGVHVQVAMHRLPNDEELERIVSWMRTLDHTRQHRLDDLAALRIAPLGSPACEALVESVGRPRLIGFCSRHGRSPNSLGTTCLRVADEEAKEFIDKKASQLLKDAPGLLVLDLSRLAGGFEQWCPFIERRLQPEINTRVSGVVVFEVSQMVGDGPRLKGRYIENRHAKTTPLPAAARSVITKFLTSDTD